MRDKKRAIDKFVTLNVQQISATLEQVGLVGGVGLKRCGGQLRHALFCGALPNSCSSRACPGDRTCPAAPPLLQVRLKANALVQFMGAQHGAQRTYALLTLANKLISQCEVQVGVLGSGKGACGIVWGSGRRSCVSKQAACCLPALPSRHTYQCNALFCTLQVTRLHSFAFPLAEVAVAVMASQPDMVPLLAARLHQVCCWAGS